MNAIDRVYVGIDDTDMPGTAGTNHCCRALVERIADRFRCLMVVRHQLLFDKRVPYTSKNSCASIQLQRTEGRELDTRSLEELKQSIRAFLDEWFVAGSDPGFCVTTQVSTCVADFGARCQRKVVQQSEARSIAEEFDIHLEGRGGTEDGVIGALAAVGLASTGNDGRIVQIGNWPDDLCGEQEISTLDRRLVEVRCVDSLQTITKGIVNVGKHLRPNYRDQRIVLFAAREFPATLKWLAVRQS